MKKRPLDPFEQHELDREDALQRMRREKRLNVVRGPANAQSLSSLKRSRRYPLNDKANEANSGGKDASSRMQKAIMDFHKSSRRVERPPNSISLLDVGVIVKESRPKFKASKTHIPVHQHYDTLLKSWKTPKSPNALSQKLDSFLKSYVNWYSDNRFEFQIDDLPPSIPTSFLNGEAEASHSMRTLQKLLTGTSAKATSFIQRLQKDKYEPRHLQKSSIKLIPTHRVVSAKSTGQFLLSVTASDLISLHEQTVFLAAPSLATSVQIGDLLVLKNIPDATLPLRESEVPFYATWHVYKS